jgi:hypothetical protein
MKSLLENLKQAFSRNKKISDGVRNVFLELVVAILERYGAPLFSHDDGTPYTSSAVYQGHVEWLLVASEAYLRKGESKESNKAIAGGLTGLITSLALHQQVRRRGFEEAWVGLISRSTGVLAGLHLVVTSTPCAPAECSGSAKAAITGLRVRSSLARTG